MGIQEEYEDFSTRDNFNKFLLHFQLINEIIADFETGYNLADVVNVYLSSGKMAGNQIAPMLSALLVDKYRYWHFSFNLRATLTHLNLAEIVGKWDAVDIVVSYYHPETGIQLINPKNSQHWENMDALKKYEMVTVYTGCLRDTIKKLENQTFSALLKAVGEKMVVLLGGGKVKVPASFTEGGYKVKKFGLASDVSHSRTASRLGKTSLSKTKGATPKVSAASKSKKGVTATSATPETRVQVTAQVSPRGGLMTKVGPFGVVVSNELFHNGNVEAWKRIIFSYTSKFTSYQVQVYYDGEVIHDLNSLFKWGKVKHGTAILVAISGPEQQLRDVSKLRKYLIEGASPRFEQFLHGVPGKDLGLF